MFYAIDSGGGLGRWPVSVNTDVIWHNRPTSGLYLPDRAAMDR
jgi:hypothetical protein